MSLILIDAKGDKKPFDLSVDMYKQAADANQTLPQFLASQYPTDHAKYGSPFEQLLEQSGIFVHGNREHGITKSTVGQLLDTKSAANAITRDGVPASRLLMPAVVLSVIEDKLQDDTTSDSVVFDSMIAVDDSIGGDRFERMVLNTSEYQHVRSMPVAQLAEPNIMMSITVSDTSKRIPTFGIGVEVSDQARNQSIDLVAHSIAMQAKRERNIRTQDHILNILNGDTDVGMLPLAQVNGAVTKAKDHDASISAANVLTQRAWLKWLRGTGYNTAPITHVITDLEGYLLFEERKGQPTSADNITGVRKPNSSAELINANWPTSVKFFITNNPAWPAGTYLGFDANQGLHRVKSLSAEYSAVENFVMRRSTQMRFDSGEVVYRLYDDAFRVLSLSV